MSTEGLPEPETGGARESRTMHRARRLLQHGRAGLGVILLVAPGLLLRWMDIESTPTTRLLARVVAIRGALLGFGTIAAEFAGSDAGWFEAGAVADAADALVIGAVVNKGQIPRVRGYLTMALAIVAAGTGVVLSADSRRRAAAAG